MKSSSAIFGLALVLWTISACTSRQEQQVTHFETENEALEGLAFMAAIQNYPYTEMPTGKFYRAFEHIQKMSSHARETGGDVWERIGPNNVGGRTNSIAIHPVDTNIIFLGSASGGLWKSVTGGMGENAWTYVETGFPVLGVSAIAMNPDDPDEMFIGTGETYSYGTATNGLITRTERGSYGMGILHSTDGGTTWEISLDWTYQENRGIWDIVFDPSNTNNIIAATTEGIYKSYDGGLNWEQVLNRKMVMDLSVHPDAPDLMFAGVGNLNSISKGIYRSLDGGDSWSVVTGGGLPVYVHDGRIGVAQWAGDPNSVLAVISNAFSTVGIYASEDGGNTWDQLDDEEVMSYQGWYAKGILRRPDDHDQILFGGVELWKTENAGGSIIQMTSYAGPDSELHPDIHDIISNPLDPEKVYILTDGGLFRSNDFGDSYFPCVDGYVTSQFYIGSISAQTNEKGLGGLQDNFTQRYDGTNYWTAVIGGDGAYNAIDQTDDNIQYGSYQYGNFYKSTDGGNSFWDYIFGPTGASAFVAPLMIAPSNSDVLYTGDTYLWRSDNQGASFFKPEPLQADSGNVLLSIGVSTFSPDTVYFTTAGVSGSADVFRSFDGGETIECITNGLPDRYFRDIAVDPHNGAIMYLAVGGFNTGHIFRSANSGADWEDISLSLPDVPFHTIAIDPYDQAIIYAGSDFGAFVSTDNGITWNMLGTGMPQAVMVFDLQISPFDDHLIAYTHGNGVYRIPLLGGEKQVDIENASTSVNFALYPTIASDMIHVEVTGDRANVFTLSCIDMQGKVHYTKVIPHAGMTAIDVDVSKLSAGQYFIVVSSADGVLTKRFLRS